MVQTAELRERDMLDILREKYEGDGYSFFAYPSGSVVPGFLQGYQPDAIAVRGDERVAIEVKQKKSSSHGAQLSEIAKRFAKQPDWKFLVVYPDEVAPEWEQFGSLSAADIERQLGEVEELSNSKHSRAAFVLAWAILEALARALAGSPIGVAARSPRDVVEFLERNGLIDFKEGNILRDLVALRNAAVHGDFARKVGQPDLDVMMKIARRLAAEAKAAA